MDGPLYFAPGSGWSVKNRVGVICEEKRELVTVYPQLPLVSPFPQPPVTFIQYSLPNSYTSTNLLSGSTWRLLQATQRCAMPLQPHSNSSFSFCRCLFLHRCVPYFRIKTKVFIPLATVFSFFFPFRHERASAKTVLGSLAFSLSVSLSLFTGVINPFVFFLSKGFGTFIYFVRRDVPFASFPSKRQDELYAVTEGSVPATYVFAH